MSILSLVFLLREYIYCPSGEAISMERNFAYVLGLGLTTLEGIFLNESLVLATVFGSNPR